MLDLLKKALPYLVFTGVILGLGYAAYRYGYRQGSGAVKLEWEQDKSLARAVQDSLVRKIAKEEEYHRVKQQEIADELVQVREQAEVAAAGIRASYEQRLLQSARRAELYQRQAQAGAAAQRDLAGHAARLDRALEEGVELVGELQATLGLRERQLILLGDQIRNDRQACEGQPDDR